MSMFSTRSKVLSSVAAVALGFTVALFTSDMASALTNACAGTPVASPDQYCTKNIENLSNGLAWYAIAAAIVGILVSAVLWALGSKGQNPGQELTGKRGLIVCLTAAFCVGALSPYINKLSDYADDVKNSSGYATNVTPAVGCDTNTQLCNSNSNSTVNASGGDPSSVTSEAPTASGGGITTKGPTAR